MKALSESYITEHDLDVFENMIEELKILNTKKKKLVDMEVDESKTDNEIDSNCSATTLDDYYVVGLTTKIIHGFITYGTVKYKSIYSRGLLLFNQNQVQIIRYDPIKLRFYFRVKQYKLNIKFSTKSIKNKLISSRDIIDCQCDCKYPNLCKHICAALFSIKDDEYVIQPFNHFPNKFSVSIYNLLSKLNPNYIIIILIQF